MYISTGHFLMKLVVFITCGFSGNVVETLAALAHTGIKMYGRPRSLRPQTWHPELDSLVACFSC